MTEQPPSFFLIIADHDRGLFSVEGPMTGQRLFDGQGRQPLRKTMFKIPRRLILKMTPEGGASAMPTDWTDKVRAAITNLETKTDRVLEPDQALAIIDDVVAGKFAAAELATIHGIPQAWIRTTLGQITRAIGSGGVRSLAAGSWYESKSDDQPYDVAAGFAAAWKKARGLS